MTRFRALPTVAFVLLACGLAWLVALPLWLGDGLASPLAGVLIPVMMFTPAVAAVIVMLVFGFPARGERLRILGMWPLRPARRVIWLSLVGLLGPVVIVALSIAIASLCGWVELDLIGLSGAQALLEATTPEGVPVPPAWVVVVSQLVALPFAAATVNAVFAFGEELGWRGFLVPALRPLGVWPTLLISGVIWGLWHAPVILLGYNFGRADMTGVLFMTGGCIGWGILLGWLRLRSASVWPAVFAHGALNAAGALVVMLAAAGTPIDMAFAGPLGVAGWIACAVVIVGLAVTGQFSAARMSVSLDAPPAPEPVEGPEPVAGP